MKKPQKVYQMRMSRELRVRYPKEKEKFVNINEITGLNTLVSNDNYIFLNVAADSKDEAKSYIKENWREIIEYLWSLPINTAEDVEKFINEEIEKD